MWMNPDGEPEQWKEKADQIRIYSGAGYAAVNEAPAGTVCAVTGLTRTVSGQGLGSESGSNLPLLEPVLTYGIKFPPECDVHVMFLKLKQLEEEIPELHLVWDERLGELHVQVMGEVQIEILKSMILERFGVSVEFGSGSIVYKETIAAPVEGVGHFEPLRHYAEVHLLLEPGEPGSGLEFASCCSTDELDLNWQRLILTHLEEKQHRGVLMGAEITDMKITLVSGRAHIKHTEGGDFRQATYRAVRQGLRQAQSILLEPVYEYRLELPAENVGRAMADIQKMQGTFAGPELDSGLAVLTGSAPVSGMRDYQREVNAYTRGCGRLFCTLKGYQPCHNAQEVIEMVGYDPDSDLDNPCGSVFCTHGAGFVVPWDQVRDYMHLESAMPAEEDPEPEEALSGSAQGSRVMEHGIGGRGSRGYAADIQDDGELYEIFQRTFGSVKQDRGSWNRRTRGSSSLQTQQVRRFGETQLKDQYLLVDGYRILFLPGMN